jgi:hypothetical protein
MSRRRYLYGILSQRSGVCETPREIPLEDWLALAASEF